MVKKKTITKKPSPAADYGVGEWAGQVQLTCKHCQFDTLAGEAAMLTHLVEAHGSEAALDALFPNRAQVAPAIAVQLREPVKADSEGIPEGDPANGVYEIDIEEVGDGTSESD